VGTRFIVSTESKVDASYKEAVLKATPEDIVMTTRVSGTPAAVIKTPYVEKIGLELPFYLKILKDNPRTKKMATGLIHLMGMKQLEKAATGASWKTVWSAGQSVGLIESEQSCAEILHEMVREYHQAKAGMP
jgi:nitronate monooxygenase